MQGGLIFTGGPILTMADRMAADAVAVAYGRIQHVGTLADCRAVAGSAYKEIDLDGRCLVPGFIDAHAHMVFFAQSRMMANLGSEQIRSINDLIAALKTHAGGFNPTATVRGFGYNQNKLMEKRHPTAADLDRVVDDRPLYILHTSGHCAVANSFLLRKAGIGLDTPDPEGGTLERDADGYPTGVVKDNAMKLIVGEGVQIGSHGPNFHFPEEPSELAEMVGNAVKSYLAAGITTHVDVQVTRREMETYLAARAAGILETRVVMMYISAYLDELIKLGLNGIFGDEFLSMGPVKIYADGATVGRTARLSEPYSDAPDEFGHLYHTPEALTELIVKAHRHGFQTATHGIGDEGIDLILNAIETAQNRYPRADARHRIEHCTLPREDQLPRIKALNIWPILQAISIYELGDGYINLVGKKRAERMAPLGALKRYGIPLVISSDSPVADYRPLLGIWAAVNRTTLAGKVLGKALAISVADALKAYTINAAASIFREKDLGSIEAGKCADFVLLDQNPLETTIEDLKEISVVETWVAGNLMSF